MRTLFCFPHAYDYSLFGIKENNKFILLTTVAELIRYATNPFYSEQFATETSEGYSKSYSIQEFCDMYNKCEIEYRR